MNISKVTDTILEKIGLALAAVGFLAVIYLVWRFTYLVLESLWIAIFFT